MSQAKQPKMAIVGVFILIGILPVAIYWLSLGRVPTVTASEAIQKLETGGGSVVLVDVRDALSYQHEHIDGAANLPLNEVQQLQSPEDLPESWLEKSLLVICSTGFKSVEAAQHLLAIGLSDVHNVRGGMQEWAKAGVENPDSNFSYFVAQDQAPYQMAQTMSKIEQSLQVLIGFAIKPAHMILSALLIWILLGNSSLDTTLVKWALVALLVGEAFCAFNFLFFNDDSLLSEHIHNVGMIMSFTLAGWAIIEGSETRVLRMGASQKPCALVGLCGKCDKLAGDTCKGRQILKWALLAAIIVALLPLTIRPGQGSVSGWILGSPYFYSELYVFQLFEARYLPVVAIIFFVMGWLTLRANVVDPIPNITRLFLAAGLGCLGFALFRLGLHYLYEEQVLWFRFGRRRQSSSLLFS